MEKATSSDGPVSLRKAPVRKLARLIARGMSSEDARRRLAAQLPAAEKAARANHVIDTSGTFEETDAHVDRLLRALAS